MPFLYTALTRGQKKPHIARVSLGDWGRYGWGVWETMYAKISHHEPQMECPTLGALKASYRWPKVNKEK